MSLAKTLKGRLALAHPARLLAEPRGVGDHAHCLESLAEGRDGEAEPKQVRGRQLERGHCHWAADGQRLQAIDLSCLGDLRDRVSPDDSIESIAYAWLGRPVIRTSSRA